MEKCIDSLQTMKVSHVRAWIQASQASLFHRDPHSSHSSRSVLARDAGLHPGRFFLVVLASLLWCILPRTLRTIISTIWRGPIQENRLAGHGSFRREAGSPKFAEGNYGTFTDLPAL